MVNPQWKKKFLSMFLILCSLFIIIFFTKWYYEKLIITMDSISDNEQKHTIKKKELDNLWKIKNELEKNTWDKVDIIKKYSNKLNEDEIIIEIYSSAANTRNWKTKVNSLSMTKWVKNELWFIESKINISLEFSNEEVMKEYIDYLTKESKYKFFMTNFNYPIIKEGKSISTNFSLVLFYVNIK